MVAYLGKSPIATPIITAKTRTTTIAPRYVNFIPCPSGNGRTLPPHVLMRGKISLKNQD